MTHSEDRIPVRIAYVGGGSLNWAPKLMTDLAHDTRLAAEVRLHDLDQAAARRNAAMGARFAEAARGTPARSPMRRSCWPTSRPPASTAPPPTG
ncbi:family 4 glycosyl hydrolase [Mangrovicoccus ximenensis]|uniref:family 4 glycosyl hydrolase n=1 Tax=Mangrovicoccus ximenensis TaxID=1911570 RepID=UPI000D396912|nr:hypothetical protein [Mangrovicoccus ximenensis]